MSPPSKDENLDVEVVRDGNKTNDASPKKEMKVNDPRPRLRKTICGPTELKRVSGKVLHELSLASKKLKVVKMDCRIPENLEHLDAWMQINRPSNVRKEDGFGMISLVGPGKAKDEDESTEENLLRRQQAQKKWHTLVEAPDANLTYQDIRLLAKEFDLLGGKWMLHVLGDQVDRLWHRVAWCLAHDRLPSAVLEVHVTTREQKQEHTHVISIHTRDFTQEDEIFEVEKALRKTGITNTMTYKPDIHSALGIYRYESRMAFRSHF